VKDDHTDICIMMLVLTSGAYTKTYTSIGIFKVESG
jgi:hypothetical protein